MPRKPLAAEVTRHRAQLANAGTHDGTLPLETAADLQRASELVNALEVVTDRNRSAVVKVVAGLLAEMREETLQVALTRAERTFRIRRRAPK